MLHPIIPQAKAKWNPNNLAKIPLIKERSASQKNNHEKKKQLIKKIKIKSFDNNIDLDSMTYEVFKYFLCFLRIISGYFGFRRSHRLCK